MSVKIDKGVTSHVRAKRRAPAKTPPRVRLDHDIERVLIAATDVRRMINHQLRRLSRKHKLSERGLNILTMVNSGINRPGMLIDYFEVLPSTITSETDRLVAAGLLERQSHPTDRRVNLLALTARGHAVREEALALLNQTFRSRLDEISPEHVQICVETLCAIHDGSVPETPPSRKREP